jgi:hypothetical protein
VGEINEILQKTFELCARFWADVIGKWISRDSVSEADALSRQSDTTDWGIAKEVFEQACEIFKYRPSLDVFASDCHHTAEKFVFEFFTPRCCAVDALRLDCAQLAMPGEVVWVFPPFQCVGIAISLIEEKKLDALICMPMKTDSTEYYNCSS